MDSITQFVLGAAVGEVTLKRVRPAESAHIGKAFRWGAFWLGGLVGTLPDLDVLFRKHLTGPQALGFHRGVTHSIFFCTLVTPILAWLLSRIFRNYDVTWRQWNVFVWLGLNTHWMIDSLTTYGTQVFLPFSNYPVNVGSVFIIDPMYTLPLLAGLLWTLFVSRGRRPYRPGGVQAALLFSTAYLVMTLASKYAVLARFESSLETQGIAYQKLISVATPFNSILWYGYADSGEDVWVADSSLLDPWDRDIVWQRIPKGLDAVKNFGEGVADRRLLWFSRGFYRLDLVNGQPIFIDLRFGRLKSWLLPIAAEGDDYMFRFALQPASEQGPYSDFRRLRPSGLEQFPWDVFWRRLLGRPAQPK
jgi:inner membrane protein